MARPYSQGDVLSITDYKRAHHPENRVKQYDTIQNKVVYFIYEEVCPACWAETARKHYQVATYAVYATYADFMILTH